ncbi:hypothetical protein AURDEDRAFT_166583 [Auricularia subglabra TFB-10046 SS5]|nr:hypothetical protein AURDEDRAFT_166583 [Auricularia subglabra TFB-10046 SS5]
MLYHATVCAEHLIRQATDITRRLLDLTIRRYDCVRHTGIAVSDLVFDAAERSLGALPLSGPARRLVSISHSAARTLFTHDPRRAAEDENGRDASSSAELSRIRNQLRQAQRQRDALLVVMAYMGREDDDESDESEPATPSSACAAPDLPDAKRKSMRRRHVRWANECEVILPAHGDGHPARPPQLDVSKQQWLPQPPHLALPAVDRAVAQDGRRSGPAASSSPELRVDVIHE